MVGVRSGNRQAALKRNDSVSVGLLSEQYNLFGICLCCFAINKSYSPIIFMTLNRRKIQNS